ncbi:TonB-dependent Receptor Plug Domain [Hyunsoonleella jejuensis]|uniref:TonB-dependent Receptor Plug Domain n=1 Tax=Hyunsoonleella jejuensis TaxID=419940 RepID=A0A1H9JMB6_9FLAO|nr:M56 family metallopeptidase [Hyunsoonleella jejuensis]SEQ88074.1 TonB-dependent Receptor Plug Domain [Hyunsoonleella jejuensis]
MEYLLKTCGIVVIFYLFYLVFLKKETFFKWNRLFLIGGLVLAAVLPDIIIPVYVEYTPIDTSNFVLEASEINNTNPSLGTEEFLALLYLSGVVCFLVHFIFQFFSLMTIIWNSKQKRIGKYIYVETKKQVLPFSFFNWIVYNPNGFNNPELEQILTHERMHADQYHSIDVLLSQMFCILLWFNPFVWLYAKSLKQNLEFLADHSAIKQSKCKTSYQYTLLKASVPTYQLVLSNNFYNSLIKKRIVMLHKSQSKKTNHLKFLLIAPVLAIFLMSFNTEAVFIQKETTPVYNISTEAELDVPNMDAIKPAEKTSIPKIAATNKLVSKKVAVKAEPKATITAQDKKPDEIIIITKNTSDDELNTIAASQKENGITLNISGVQRNKDGEITAINIIAKTAASNANYSVNSDNPIKSIIIQYDSDDNSISIGNAKYSNNYAFVSSDGKKKVISAGKNKNLVIVEEIREEKGDSEDDVIEEVITITETNAAENKKVIIKNNEESEVIIKTSDTQNPIYIIDGKEVKQKKLEKINPNTIESINVLKGDGAIEAYGDKGKNGVVEIHTKKKK